MSDPGKPTVPTSLSITGNPALDGVILKGIMIAATFLTTWAMSHLNMKDPDFALYLSAAIVSVLGGIATLIWGWLNARIAQAKSVTAGMNLALAGAALMEPARHGLSTPTPVTTATAQEIVKNFGDVKVAVPDEPALTEKLNQTQIITPTK